MNFKFIAKDASSDKGQATVIIAASSLIECKTILEELKNTKKRPDLEFVCTSVTEPAKIISEDIEQSTDYNDRLVFNFEVSDKSPVIKGTWVTVKHLASLIIEGWSHADILRSHPELRQEDIHAAVRYTVEN